MCSTASSITCSDARNHSLDLVVRVALFNFIFFFLVAQSELSSALIQLRLSPIKGGTAQCDTYLSELCITSLLQSKVFP